MDDIRKVLEEGNQLAGNGKYDEAISRYATGLKADPENHELLYNQAKAYFKVKEFSKAVGNFDLLLEKFPDNAEIISERGVLFHHLGDNEKALEELNKAAGLEPQNPFRYSSRAWIKAALKDIEGAIADYDKAIALDPDDAISYNNKGLLEDQLGYRQAAKKSFDKSNELSGYRPEFNDVKENSSQHKKVSKNRENDGADDERLTTQGYMKTLKSLIKDKQERQQFFSFLKSMGRK